jgi:hypothetical protein
VLPVDAYDRLAADLVADAGLPFLAGLPRLREVHLDSLPGVTLESTQVFPPNVRVRYST